MGIWSPEEALKGSQSFAMALFGISLGYVPVEALGVGLVVRSPMPGEWFIFHPNFNRINKSSFVGFIQNPDVANHSHDFRAGN
jgi:hypothetical protein